MLTPLFSSRIFYFYYLHSRYSTNHHFVNKILTVVEKKLTSLVIHTTPRFLCHDAYKNSPENLK